MLVYCSTTIHFQLSSVFSLHSFFLLIIKGEFLVICLINVDINLNPQYLCNLFNIQNALKLLTIYFIEHFCKVQ